MHNILKIYLLITALGISHVSIAEVVLDGTLGSSGALVGPNFTIESHLGQQVGNNLFHSFETFNINQHERVTFSGPKTINNIISRVTGGKTSNINGLLASTIPDADMYLINPAGIIFGEHANLDVKGSFHASTADYLRLGQNGRFDASHPENSLLTVAPPSAFGFLDESPAGIEKYGFLTVADGKSISLIGGDLTLEDNHIIAPSGQINLMSVASSGEVPVDPINISDKAFEQFGTIKIINTDINKLDNIANIDVSGEGGGRVYIQGGEIIMENVDVCANTKGAKNGQGITIKATEQFVAKGLTTMMTKALENSIGNGGNINIDAREIKLTDGAYIITNTESSGSAGNITLTATENINFNVNGCSKKLASGLLANTIGTGKGGNINITASAVTLEDSSFIHAITGSRGDAGNISLQVNTLTLKTGANVSVRTAGTGHGGILTVTAKEAVLITGQLSEGKPSSLDSETASGQRDNPPGNGGSIIVSTPLLEIQDQGTIKAGSEKLGGTGGKISLNVDRLDISQGGKITTDTKSILGNSGGEINIKANQISIADKGIITASSSGTGNAGNIKITSPGYLHLRNSEITTSAKNSHAGKITLNSEFIILDNSYIKADADEGDAGNINIRTTGIYNFSGESAQDITAESKKGLDGLVTINSPDIDISNSLTQILPKTFLDAASLLRKPCATRSGLNLSSLSIIRGDVVPKDPMQLAAPGFKSCHVY